MAGSMSRWTKLVGALLLVLMVWTGSSAHALERLECIPVTEQSAGHFDGDRDQTPDNRDQGVTHHHGGCNGHHVATPGQSAAISFSALKNDPSSALVDAGSPGPEPDRQLRPPIA